MQNNEVMLCHWIKRLSTKKERRKPYYGSKAISCSCRNNGSCDWCRENRLYKTMIQQDVMDAKLDEYKKGETEDEVIDRN